MLRHIKVGIFYIHHLQEGRYFAIAHYIKINNYKIFAIGTKFKSYPLCQFTSVNIYHCFNSFVVKVSFRSGCLGVIWLTLL